jgi:hypothetical protein
MIKTATGKLHRSARRHDLQIAEVPVPADAAHVKGAEAFDRRVVIGISRCVVATCDRVWAQLHQTEGRCSARKSLAFANFLFVLAPIRGLMRLARSLLLATAETRENDGVEMHAPARLVAERPANARRDIGFGMVSS